MFGPLGVPEVLFILVIALLIFGPRRLPEIGRTFGKAMGEFRRATTELKRSINTEIALEDDEEERPRFTRSARSSVEKPDDEIEVSTDGLKLPGRSEPRSDGGEPVGEPGGEPGVETAGDDGTAEGTAAAGAAAVPSGEAEASKDGSQDEPQDGPERS